MPPIFAGLRPALNLHPTMAAIGAGIVIVASFVVARPFITSGPNAARDALARIDGGSPDAPNSAEARSEFDLVDALIPIDRIRRGGPPKDGIPALNYPEFAEAAKATFLDDADRVVGVTEDGQAKACPLKILGWHEVVNDQIGDRPIAVTYCPLCDSSAVFARDGERQLLELGVSGLLYNSNVLMYDRDPSGPSGVCERKRLLPGCV